MGGMSGSVMTSTSLEEGPRVHRKSLVGFRTACERMWGKEGYESLCRDLPADVRERTAGMRPLPDWNALEDLIAWHVAVWNGPAKNDEQIMAQLIDGSVDHGFGHVKRFLLSISTPQSLAPRVVALWREEYSTGRLEASLVEQRSVRLTLHDHPYVDIPLMRLVLAEVFSYVVSLTKVKQVSAAHAVRDSALVVALHWT
jgi:hypothetical protein